VRRERRRQESGKLDWRERKFFFFLVFLGLKHVLSSQRADSPHHRLLPVHSRPLLSHKFSLSAVGHATRFALVWVMRNWLRYWKLSDHYENTIWAMSPNSTDRCSRARKWCIATLKSEIWNFIFNLRSQMLRREAKTQNSTTHSYENSLNSIFTQAFAKELPTVSS
jgi:hypothetical protein